MYQCPYPRCGFCCDTQAGVDDHVLAVPAGDPDHDHNRGGRPTIGGPYHMCYGENLLARVDAWASNHTVSRAVAVRMLLGRALDREQAAAHHADVTTALAALTEKP
jgi:hypothetical protein